MPLKTIRLELARDPEHPQGSARHGYEFMAPLREDGHIDSDEWRSVRKQCRVWRFWEAEPDEYGHLVRVGNGWAFHYDVDGDPDADESGYRFDSHAFKPGEYVSIREHDGDLKTFRVASVRPACAPHPALSN